jgi:curved DNA-binding protein
MSVRYKDYYKVLGSSRTDDQETLQKSFRKLARKYHPDVNKDPDAEERFKEINEAYEVLKDPEKRAKYDRLGANWEAGDPFEGFSGGSPFRGGFSGGGPSGFSGGNFSEFFETLFGGDPFSSQGGNYSPFGEGSKNSAPHKGEDQEVEITINLADAYHGTTRNLNLSKGDGSKKTYQVKIPAGATEGMKIRLSGQGKQSVHGGARGDLFLKVHLEPHPLFNVDGKNINTRLNLAPWEAALGAKVQAPTLDGMVTLTIPPCAQSGQKMRLKGKGFPFKNARGDLHVELVIVIPEELSPEEIKLFEKLNKVSRFNPRNETSEP